jgi:hypothetical protein
MIEDKAILAKAPIEVARTVTSLQIAAQGVL